MSFLQKILAWCKSLDKSDFTIAFLIVIIGVLVYFYINLNSELSEARLLSINLNNTLASKDSLHRVLSENNKVLYERYAYQYEKVNKLLSENSLLKKYLKNKDAEVIALSTSIQQITIENLALKGKLDSTGFGADFSYQSNYLTLDAYATVRPEPLLTLKGLSIFDSTSVAFVEEEGMYKGYIEHSNPYIINKNADFILSIPKGTSSGVSLPVAGGFAVAVGIICAVIF